MDHIGLVIIIKGTRTYAYKPLEQYILKMAYITEIKGYIWRIRDYILDCPFGFVAVLGFFGLPLLLSCVAAANTWQSNLLLICTSKHCGESA